MIRQDTIKQHSKKKEMYKEDTSTEKEYLGQMIF